MREGYSITDDATVVRTAAAPAGSAAAEYAKTPYPAGIR
jgi:hypothetical protein